MQINCFRSWGNNLCIAQCFQRLVPVAMKNPKWEKEIEMGSNVIKTLACSNANINGCGAQQVSSMNLPNIDWMLYWAFPVRVLVHDCCENFIQMIPVCVAYISAQYFRSSIGLDAVLNIFEIERKIRFGSSHSN